MDSWQKYVKHPQKINTLTVRTGETKKVRSNMSDQVVTRVVCSVYLL